ncbi:MAG: putative molibdopterin-dependent oxidoreductase YjgC [Chlamydiales bacterium]|jgi:predicted molibdopterin-dependent oxidoreductase YjgC
MRVAGKHGKAVRFKLDGEVIEAYEGESIAAALLASGRRSLRRTERYGGARGLFCGIGVCHDCRVQVDSRANVRACVTPVSEGMQIETQHGTGTWGLTS